MELSNPCEINIKQKESTKTPRDYQKEAIDKLDKNHKPFGEKPLRGILQIPTGGGKTLTAVYWAFTRLVSKGYKLVWIAHRTDLLIQARETMIEQGGLLKGLRSNPTINVFGGGFSKGSTLSVSKDDILIISINTIARHKGEKAFMKFIKKNNNEHILFVIDEAHHSVASSYKYIIKTYIRDNSNYSLLGLSATPTRTVEREQNILWDLYDRNLIYKISLSELITNNTLAKPVPKTVLTNENFENEFDEKAIKHFERFHDLNPELRLKVAKSSKRNKIIVDEYKTNIKKYGKTIVFAIDRIHCKTLYTEFSKISNLFVDYTYSGLGKGVHNEKIRKFKNGETDVLINIEKLTEGFDDPLIQTVFLARPTQSEILFTQMIGRGLRGIKSNGTEFVYLVSFEDHWEKFTGWLDLESLNLVEQEEDIPKGKPISKNSIKTTFSWDLINQIYYELRDILNYNDSMILKTELLPLGWYSIDISSDDLPSIRTILVFANQKESWNSIISELKKMKRKPDSDKITSLFNYWFNDISKPIVKIDSLIDFIDDSFSDGGFDAPAYYEFEEREISSPANLADKIWENGLGGLTKRNKITNWYNSNPVLEEIYRSEEVFSKTVDEYLHIKDYPDSNTKTEITIGNQFLEIEKLNFELYKCDDKELEDLVVELSNDKILFPEGFNYKVNITWTQRIMKSYYGIAYIGSDRMLIKINRILNSNIVNQKELVKYIVYHEMLHFSVGRLHNEYFRIREAGFENSIELDGILDSLSAKYDIKGFNKLKSC